MAEQESSNGGPAQAHAAPLARAMFGFGALLLTVSLITPAFSVFGIGSQVIAQAGTGAVWAFLAGAVVCVPVALVYAELSSAFPLAGQEYSIVGRVMGPVWGFMALGINIVGGAFTQAATALVLAVYLGVVIPGAPIVPTALAAVIAATAVGILNIRVNAVVTGLFLAAELATLGAITWLGAGHPHRGFEAVILHPALLSPAGHLTGAPLSIIALATAGAIFAYNGFGSAVSFGEEVHDANRRIASVILWALVVAVVSEIVPVIAVAVGAPDLSALLGAASPVTAFIALGGPVFARIVSLGVAVAIINAIIATMLINARQIYATGRDGAWPAAWNHAVTRIHPRFQSPWVATLVAGGLAAAMCFIGLKFLLTLTAYGIVGTYALVCVSALIGRATGSTAHGHYRMPLFPLGPCVALLALAGVTLGALLDPVDGQKSLAGNAAIMAAFAGYYLLFLRRRGRWALRGPEGDLA